MFNPYANYGKKTKKEEVKQSITAEEKLGMLFQRTTANPYLKGGAKQVHAEIKSLGLDIIDIKTQHDSWGDLVTIVKFSDYDYDGEWFANEYRHEW